MGTDLHLTVEDSLELVPSEQWAAVACGRGVYMSRPWLRAVQRRERGRTTTRYLLAWRGADLVGALPTYFCIAPGPDSFYDPVTQFLFPPAGSFLTTPVTGYRDYSSAVADWYPLLLGGSMSAYWNDLLLAESSDLDHQVVTQFLLDAYLDLKQQTGARSAALMYLRGPSERLLRASSCPGAVTTFLGAFARLPLPEGDFDDYLASVSAGRRSAIRKEIGRFRSAWTISKHRLSDRIHEIPPLLAQVSSRHGRDVSPAEIETDLRAVACSLDDASMLLVAESTEGHPVGCSLSYKWEDRLFTRAVGLDYEHLAGAFEYFNLCFYEPIRYALENRLSAIELGLGTSATKVSRGASLSPAWCFVIAPDNLPSVLRDGLGYQASTSLDDWGSDHPFALDSA